METPSILAAVVRSLLIPPLSPLLPSSCHVCLRSLNCHHPYLSFCFRILCGHVFLTSHAVALSVIRGVLKTARGAARPDDPLPPRLLLGAINESCYETCAKEGEECLQHGKTAQDQNEPPSIKSSRCEARGETLAQMCRCEAPRGSAQEAIKVRWVMMTTVIIIPTMILSKTEQLTAYTLHILLPSLTACLPLVVSALRDGCNSQPDVASRRKQHSKAASRHGS